MPDSDTHESAKKPVEDSEQTASPAPCPGDRELIRWALSLSVDERLAVLQDFVDSFWTPQHG